MSRDTDWFNQYDDDPGDDSDDRSRPPNWVVVVIVLSVVVGGWMLVTRESPDDDPVASPTTTVEAPVVETTTTSVVTTTASTVAGGASDVGTVPAAITSQTPQQLRGYVAVASPDASSSQDTVWVFRPGGSVVSRGDAVIRRDDAEYTMLITAGHLIAGNQIFDIDLAEPPISLWTDASVYPGSGPGVVWLTRRQDPFDSAEWVAQVDVESLTVGERVTDVSFDPIVAVADGLIVYDFNVESANFWSPTDGLVDVDLHDEVGEVLAASGNVVVVVRSRSVNVLDIERREFVSSFKFPDIPVLPTSVCLSPDGQHVIIVGLGGEAVIGNITSGEVIGLNEAIENHPIDIEREHGIGWTANDQLVFIGRDGDTKHVYGFDIAANDPFHVATLDSSGEWLLTASGTMC